MASAGKKKRWPRTGEKRRRRAPMEWDRLSDAAKNFVLDARAGRCLCQERRAHRHTWEELEQLSPGFAGRKISHSALHRGWDVRHEQANREIHQEDAILTKFSSAFAGQGIPELQERVRNALGIEFFRLYRALREGDAAAASRAWVAIAKQLNRIRQLDQEQQRLELEQQKLARLQQDGQKLRNEVAEGKVKGPRELAERLDRLFGRS